MRKQFIKFFIKKNKKKEGEKLDTIDIIQMNIKTKNLVLLN